MVKLYIANEEPETISPNFSLQTMFWFQPLISMNQANKSAIQKEITRDSI